ncbi:MAG: EF-P beta-lysylation protein EpmB [Gammaproteobacteria bacterium]|nr:EF-P beta-lysylation protein EpmB [Gammaproteobacteria bacterium]
MIPRKQAGNQTRKYYTDPLELLERLNLTPEQILFSPEAAQQFHFKVPAAYVDKIQPGTPDDPLLRQIFPVQQELSPNPDYQQDPLGEADSLSQPGLLQKYQGRALLLVTPGCAINCRYCFRRHYPYDDKGHFWRQIENNVHLLKQDPSISEVILSGGDPLSLSDNKFTDLLTLLKSIAHLKRVRIHTRFPVVEPERITKQLLNTFSMSGLRIIMVLHINHAREMGSDNQLALARLHAHRITLFNQSVLLKGVNDSVETLAQLSETLLEHHIIPYYLHMLDKVKGSAHFAISDKEAINLYQQLRAVLPGYMLPRLVREIPGENSKLPVIA